MALGCRVLASGLWAVTVFDLLTDWGLCGFRALGSENGRRIPFPWFLLLRLDVACGATEMQAVF